MLGAAVGRPGTGCFACLPAILSSNGRSVATVTTDITFAADLFAVGGCSINPEIGLGTSADKQLLEAALGSGVHRVEIAGNPSPIGDGPLYICQIGISAGTAPGSYSLTNAAQSTDPNGAALPTNGAAGAVRVTACEGDCNGDGVTSIGEIQQTVNLFLGAPLCSAAHPERNCAAADANCDGLVSIGEVQETVNAFLGGCGL